MTDETNDRDINDDEEIDFATRTCTLSLLLSSFSLSPLLSSPLNLITVGHNELSELEAEAGLVIPSVRLSFPSSPPPPRPLDFAFSGHGSSSKN
jgi:hypothetical protein